MESSKSLKFRALHLQLTTLTFILYSGLSFGFLPLVISTVKQDAKPLSTTNRTARRPKAKETKD